MWRTYYRRRISHPLRRGACRSKRDSFRQRQVFIEPFHHLCQPGTLLTLRKDASLCRLDYREADSPYCNWLSRPVLTGRRTRNSEVAGRRKRSDSRRTGERMQVSDPALHYFQYAAPPLYHTKMGRIGWSFHWCRTNRRQSRSTVLPSYFHACTWNWCNHGRQADSIVGQSVADSPQLVRPESGTHRFGPCIVSSPQPASVWRRSTHHRIYSRKTSGQEERHIPHDWIHTGYSATDHESAISTKNTVLTGRGRKSAAPIIYWCRTMGWSIYWEMSVQAEFRC